MHAFIGRFVLCIQHFICYAHICAHKWTSRGKNLSQCIYLLFIIIQCPEAGDQNTELTISWWPTPHAQVPCFCQVTCHLTQDALWRGTDVIIFAFWEQMHLHKLGLILDSKFDLFLLPLLWVLQIRLLNLDCVTKNSLLVSFALFIPMTCLCTCFKGYQPIKW